MNRTKVLTWIVRISRFGLAALFLFTAVAKLAIIKHVRQEHERAAERVGI
jgi:hypothetical protein